ncbi:MAG: hypothetical protein K2W85_00020 [Phycisphaerales bacterium]|nr:hypothetical protein [Phycisphaerales bacterium]
MSNVVGGYAVHAETLEPSAIRSRFFVAHARQSLTIVPRLDDFSPVFFAEARVPFGYSSSGQLAFAASVARHAELAPSNSIGFVDTLVHESSPIFFEGQSVPPLNQGLEWASFRRVGLLGNADLVWIADSSSEAFGAEMSTRLHYRSTAQAVISGGQQFATLPAPVAQLDGIVDFSFTANGQRRGAIVRLADSANSTAVLINSAAWSINSSRVLTGQLVGASPALAGESWDSIGHLSLNESSGAAQRTVIAGSTRVGTATRYIVVTNATVHQRDGAEFGSSKLIGPVQFAGTNSTGDVLTVWGDRDRASQIVLLNNQPILRTGDEITIAGSSTGGFRVTRVHAPIGVALGARAINGETEVFTIVSGQGPNGFETALLRTRVFVSALASCVADWDSSGVLDPADIFMFLNDWFAGVADFNASGTTDSVDIFDFLNAWFSGCF